MQVCVRVYIYSLNENVLRQIAVFIPREFIMAIHLTKNSERFSIPPLISPPPPPRRCCIFTENPSFPECSKIFFVFFEIVQYLLRFKNCIENLHSRFARAVCSIQLYRLISVASFIFGHRSIIVSQYFNISSGNRRKHTVTMKNQQSLRFNNSYFTTCFRNYTNRIRGIRPFKHPSPRIEFIKRASLFALILAASSFDNRVAREAAIQRRERRRFPTVFNPCTRVYVYVYTHA